MEDIVAAAQSAIDAGNPNSEAFLAVMRSYQAQIAPYDVTLISNALLALLPEFASGDFTAVLCLLPEKYHEMEEIKRVLHLENLLSRGQFIDFWKAFEMIREKVFVGKAWQHGMQKAIAESVRDTFQEVNAGVVYRAVGVKNEGELKAFVGDFKVSGSNITFAANTFNTPNPPAAQQSLSSTDIAQLAKMG